jgi:hypothetical protein
LHTIFAILLGSFFGSLQKTKFNQNVKKWQPQITAAQYGKEQQREREGSGRGYDFLD